MEMLIMGRAPMICNPFCINTETHAETHGNAVNGASPTNYYLLNNDIVTNGNMEMLTPMQYKRCKI